MHFLLPTLILAMTLPGPSPDTRSLIAKALNEPTHITLENVRLVDAICQITDQTGVRIVMGSEAMEFVPQGPDTIIEKVQIANVPLREGLERLFRPLGMVFELADDHLRIVPKEALLCLGRAPTWTELQTLSDLSAKRPGTNADDLDLMQNRIQFQVASPDPWGSLSQAMRNVGAGPGDEVLTAAAGQLGWSWCLSDDRIVVSPFEKMLRQRLRRLISLRLSNRPLMEVLQAIGSAVQIPIRVEPGAFAALPTQVQKNFSLNAGSMRAEQVLESIAANTGLGYLLTPDGLFFYTPGNAAVSPAPGPSPGSADPYVAKIVIPQGNGTTFEWMIRRSELPEDLRQLRERDIQGALEEVRQRRLTEGQP